jgi:carbonic anhydrase/acetyltransferase-like protein (isoleucine patch superfamily)
MLYKFDDREPVVGNGSYVSETATVVGDVKIGNNCYIGHGVVLRGDYGSIEIGDGTAIEEGVVVHAPPNDRCLIENRVTVGHGAIIHAALVGSSVTIGMGAILSIRSEVGAGSIVAEGAIVKREQKIAPSVVVAGNPARKVRDVTPKDTEYWEMAKELYINLARKYLEKGMEPVALVGLPSPPHYPA